MQNNLPPLDFSHGIPTFANAENTIVPLAMIAVLAFIFYAFSRAVRDDQQPPEPTFFFKTHIK